MNSLFTIRQFNKFDNTPIVNNTNNNNNNISIPIDNNNNNSFVINDNTKSQHIINYKARIKQINIGKANSAYNNYISKIDKKSRNYQNRYTTEPITPDIYRDVSKRAFDGLVKKWRQLIHYSYNKDDNNNNNNNKKRNFIFYSEQQQPINNDDMDENYIKFR